MWSISTFILSLMMLRFWTLINAQDVATTTYCAIKPATTLQQQLYWTDFVNKLFVQKQVNAAYQKYVVADLVEHDPFVANGAQASVDELNQILPGSTLVIYHQIFQNSNSTGWIHTKASGGSFFGDQTALVDLYRFNGSCIVEHWPLYEKRPSNYTNPNALF